MATVTMRARPIEFEVSLEAEHARGFVRSIREAFERKLDSDGEPIRKITDTPEGFRVDDMFIRSVAVGGTFESGYGTVEIRVQATSGPEAIRRVEKRLVKLGILPEPEVS
jgi:hypothetical protein